LAKLKYQPPVPNQNKTQEAFKLRQVTIRNIAERPIREIKRTLFTLIIPHVHHSVTSSYTHRIISTTYHCIYAEEKDMKLQRSRREGYCAIESVCKAQSVDAQAYGEEGRMDKGVRNYKLH